MDSRYIKERTVCAKKHPLLICADVELMLEYFLPKKELTPEELIESILRRHKIRQALIYTAEKLFRVEMGDFSPKAPTDPYEPN